VDDSSGWKADPTGRHKERFFNEEGAPTELVRDIESLDEGPTEHSPDTSTQDLLASDMVESDDERTLLATYVVSDTSIPLAQQNLPAEPEPLSAPGLVVIKRRRSWWLIAAACILAVLLIGASVVALNQRDSANEWKKNDQAEVHKYKSEVASYNSEVSSYNSEVSKNNQLSSTLVSTQSQLSAVANQKAQALDQNSVLTASLNDAANVATDLSTCVSDTYNVITAITNESNLGYYDPNLLSEATTAGQTCHQAQSEESSLQQTLSGG
jgi:hypothetical protein